MKKIIKDTFYPYKDNNHTPHFWHPLSVTFLVIILIVLSGAVVFKTQDVNEQSLLGDIKSGVVIALTNTERLEAGVPELVENEVLNQAALLKAQDMADKSYFAHYSPEGLSPWYWFTQAGYQYQKAGENLAVNFDDSKRVVNAWMNSPTHRANIIKDGYTEIGIGVAEGKYKGKNATFTVQLFGKPKNVESNIFGFTVERGTDFTLNDTVAVKGISSDKISLAGLLKGEVSSVYVYLLLLSVLSLIILFAIFFMFMKQKRHDTRFWISFVVLLICLCIALYVQVDVWKEVSITLG